MATRSKNGSIKDDPRQKVVVMLLRGSLVFDHTLFDFRVLTEMKNYY